MDMPGNDLIHTLLTAHGWYRIDTPADYIRAALWCGANLVTAVAYFLIPNELLLWRNALPFSATKAILSLFVNFIAFCGVSHLAMLFILQTAPWWTTLLIYVPMAAISATTVVVIRLNRRLILDVLDAVTRALRTRPA